MKKLFLIFLPAITLISCNSGEPESITVSVSNPLDINRTHDTVEINTSELASLQSEDYRIIDEKGNDIISQAIDYDKDGKNDVLLFQPELPAKASKTYKILAAEKTAIDSTLVQCYSRFVPERTDDFAWENNRVAFRTFGPVAQQMKEDGIKGGTLTSGMDAWLKRVEYSIINKWYAKNTKEKGAYHKDIGEGLDNFHVGVSRGIGGLAVKEDSTYAVSKNFVSYEHITNGPIRTAFILNYADWDANGKVVTEQKHISLDLGQNLSRHRVKLTGTDNVSIGITLHKKDGETSQNKAEGWMSYWEPFDDSELGQGVVFPVSQNIQSIEKIETEEKDLSHMWMNVRNDGSVEYYAGFGWKKSAQFESKEDWNTYLSEFSKCLESPLQVTVSKSSY
ncbi:hypothetical protein JCM19294_1683 [Nonlabens tegetincola]|uniref:DUF4861 domain-containing protein n=1 Tax=Nonlabens tegetincola TaxID=323273 RepID=A0A090QRG5_9FLAO|nr:DUF4861 family protein [Nonlabens tegetincola]GAK98061.1 hypothetical protein JCM19294_1683 [Nonlabens tegetincola]